MIRVCTHTSHAFSLYAYTERLPLPLLPLLPLLLLGALLHRVLLLLYRVLLLLQLQCYLLLFGIVCGMAKIVAGSLNLIPAFSFSSSKHDLISMYGPLGNKVH